MPSPEPFPLPPNLVAIPGVRPLQLEVTDVSELGPRLRRVLFNSPDLDGFSFEPGQDVMLVLGQSGDRPLSRRYSIRSFDPARGLELNIVLHGDRGVGAEWLASVEPGARVNGVGPRGKIYLDPQAAWHLFFGDLSAAPATLAMLEALAPDVPGEAFLEVPGLDDELSHALTGKHTVHWLHRGERPLGDNTLLVEAARTCALPAGTGHVYINGEVQQVIEVRDAIQARGIASEQVSPKAYWGRGKENAGNGEPEKRP